MTEGSFCGIRDLVVSAAMLGEEFDEVNINFELSEV
jgi:hypothetical protein